MVINMKLTGIAMLLSSAIVVAGLAWAVHTKTPVANHTQTNVTAITETLKDFPSVGDDIQLIGETEQHIMVALDVTSGKYDHDTNTSEFLVINSFTGEQVGMDESGRQFDMTTERVAMDCGKKQLRFITITEFFNDQVVDHVLFPVRWHAIDHTDGKTTLMEAIYNKTCPQL